jgi:GNAT superfamily N-acetyltransferase
VSLACFLQPRDARIAGERACCQAWGVAILVRAAQAQDVPALVRLRLANAERHASLDPAGYRLPEEGAVRRHFEGLLAGSGGPGGSDGRDILVLVAEVSGAVVGMSEIVMMATPPDHQILVPRRSAQVHTVVLEDYRGQGVGSTLVAAAEQRAAGCGVSRLFAPILAPNTEAVSFYSRAGFGRHGIILAKQLTPDGGQPTC